MKETISYRKGLREEIDRNIINGKRNETIRRKIEIKTYCTTNRTISMVWPSLATSERQIRQIVKWNPVGRREHGRHNITWNEGVRTNMEKRNVKDEGVARSKCVEKKGVRSVG
jgi:hypothetical protein